ncbi:uncharacterized protein LOC115471977 [Microcaecilia unicolor]|uniref:Uncharacterized protein LOC115471977 n=1 Tax=Microcaecilia unicolor TaxID=1415580 RepID=A0A6P7YFH5_9AMPH|nr:uncharacterized protein LOC115471977 [Microcaecilia unicolor]
MKLALLRKRMVRKSSAAAQGCCHCAVLRCCFFLYCLGFGLGAEGEACSCSLAVDFREFLAAQAPRMCCLNFTGSSIGTLDWSIFSTVTGLKEIDLSDSNISSIINVAGHYSSLEVLHLDGNLLTELPAGFLGDVPALKVIHLENNQLKELPESFLQASDQIQEIYLDFNNITTLPSTIFKPSLIRLGVSNNSLDCTCSLYNSLKIYFADNQSSEVLSTLTCAGPDNVRGMNIRHIQRHDLCQSHRFTALFICLPILAALGVACWCCCCRRKKKNNFAISRQECHLATVERNGTRTLIDHHQYISCKLPVPAENEKNLGLMKPSTALLGSSRDLYEEVEVKLGASVDSLLAKEGDLGKKVAREKIAMEEEVAAGSEAEAETVSVTEVLKDSTDREKLYMNQATDYYNLVPGIELDDSDHCEYESIDLH